MARMTIATTNARIDAMDARLDEVLALLRAQAPAKTVRTPARKATSKKAPVAKVTKGAQTREVLSRKDWNRTLTTKARFMGGPAYKTLLASWDEAQTARDAGMTPDEALASILA